jgi:hypothetical protein
MQAALDSFLSACFEHAPDGDLAIEGDHTALMSGKLEEIKAFVDEQEGACAIDLVTWENNAPCLLTGLGAMVQPGDTFHQRVPPTVTLAHQDGRLCAIYLLAETEVLDLRGGTTCDRLDDIAKLLGDEGSAACDPVPMPGTGGWTLAEVTNKWFTVAELDAAFLTPPETQPRFNDAFLHGTLDPILLERDIEIAISKKGSKTLPGRWKNAPMKLGAFVNLLSTHKQGEKDGECFLQGAVIDGERKANAIPHLDLLTLDLDTGESIDEVIARIKALGLFAVVYTTHSHLKAVSEVKKDEVLRWVGEQAGDITVAQVCTYFLERKRYRPGILEGAKLIGTDHTVNGVVLQLEHQPMPKFRVVMVLEKRFVIADRAASQKKAIAEWRERYAGASKLLEAYFDRSCVDPSRLMYTPRHPPGGQFRIDIIAGKPLDIEQCERVTAEELRAVTTSPFDAAAKALGGRAGDYKTTSMAWFFGKYGNRFEVDDFLLQMDPDGDRGARSSGPGRTHCCPNDDAHSDAGNPDDKGFFCVNASESEQEQAVARCSHDSCADLDRINFVDLICERLGIADASELKRWVALTEEDEEEPAKEDAAPETSLPPFKNSGDAKRAISHVKKNEDDEAVTLARRIGASDLSPGQVDGLKKTLAKQSGLSLRALDAEIKKGRSTSGKEDRVADDDVVEMLADLNTKYAGVVIGAKFKIIRKSQKTGTMPVIWEPETFQRIENRKVMVPDKDNGMKAVALSRLWIDWEERETYADGIVFEPSDHCDLNAFNLWSGFDIVPRRGDWSMLRGHLLDNVCKSNQEYFDWMMTWMAQIIQRPGEKMGSAVVIRGKKGTGKSQLFKWLARAIYPYSLTVSQRNHIVGNFNGHQSGVLLMVCEEAFWAGDVQAGGVLKNLITNDKMMMEKKGVDAIEVSNYARLAMVSNEQWVVPAGLDDERRFFVLECGEARMKDTEFFGAMKVQMESGGIEAMAYDLMHWSPPNDDWNILRNPPKTEALIEQALESMDPWDKFFVQMIQEEGCVDDMNGLEEITLYDDKPNVIRVTTLRDHFNAFIRSTPKGKNKVGDNNLLASKVKEYLLAADVKLRPRQEIGRPYFWVCPPISQMRAALVAKNIQLDKVTDDESSFKF